jgi:hypothetical protein
MFAPAAFTHRAVSRIWRRDSIEHGPAITTNPAPIEIPPARTTLDSG